VLEANCALEQRQSGNKKQRLKQETFRIANSPKEFVGKDESKVSLIGFHHARWSDVILRDGQRKGNS